MAEDKNGREALRTKALAELAILDTSPEREFDALAATARRLLGTRSSSFTLIDEHRQWFKARCGMPHPESPRGPALCTWVVENEQMLVLPDASRDPQFASNPLVTGQPNIRFYAGVPVNAQTSDGDTVPIGTLCVLDDRPREVKQEDIDALADLARIAEALVEARSVARRATVNADALREANARLERERRQLKQAERLADMGSWRLTLEDKGIEWSDGVYRIHEVPIGDSRSLDAALDFYPEVDRLRVEASLAAAASGAAFEFESDFVTAKGNLRRVRCVGEAETVDGKPVAVIGVVHDITARHQMERELLRISRTDGLTGLANRAEFDRVLDERLAEAEVFSGELAVLLIDLDGFNGLNDALGHAAGDEALRRVADHLQSLNLSGCFAARLGGDEFAVIVPGTMAPDVFARMLDTLLVELRIPIGDLDRSIEIGGTVGYAWSGDVSGGREDLLRCADTALCAAKRSRKGTARMHVPRPSAASAMSS